MASDGVVLIVEDETDLADLYATWIGDAREVRVAYSGESGLNSIDDAVDVVLLDRRLPGMSGDEFLDRIRADGLDCAVAMVSAVEPNVDIVEMPFDEYLTKPIRREELLAAIDRLLAVSTSPESVRDYLALSAKRETLDDQLSGTELETSEEYGRITAAMEAFEMRVVDLAEAVLASGTDELRPDDRRELQRERDRLEREREGLPDNDPLRSVLSAEIEELDSLLGADSGDVAPRQEFLDVVAEGFVAQGFWLDPTVLRALNQLFFDKESDRLVLEHRPLTPSSDLDGKELVTVSTAVRNRAAAAKRR